MCKFNDLKIGIDDNTDGDLNDAGDKLAVDESFDSTSATVSYDKAGNLIDDGTYEYVYDAWHRLVKVSFADDGGILTLQTAEFDATGRRLKKVVTNAGDHNATVIYLFDGQKIIETRDGSENMVQQFIHGTRYVDELVQLRVKDKGDLYVHQDANWNVVALTDLGGSVVERYVYTPYGEVIVQQDTAYGDRDGDKDVDSADKGTPGTDCTGTVSGACRILDFDFDGDYDSTDATTFDGLEIASSPTGSSNGMPTSFRARKKRFQESNSIRCEPLLRARSDTPAAGVINPGQSLPSGRLLRAWLQFAPVVALRRQTQSDGSTPPGSPDYR